MTIDRDVWGGRKERGEEKYLHHRTIWLVDCDGLFWKFAKRGPSPKSSVFEADTSLTPGRVFASDSERPWYGMTGADGIDGRSIIISLHGFGGECGHKKCPFLFSQSVPYLWAIVQSLKSRIYCAFAKKKYGTMCSLHISEALSRVAGKKAFWTICFVLFSRLFWARWSLDSYDRNMQTLSS